MTRVLAIIQAGGTGGRMDVLTRERAKPALPFAGVYQLVDFPLSNLTHSGITDVWLSVQFQGATLEEQVANGRPWDLDRTRGGLRLLMPQEGTGTLDEDGFATGNADELYRIRDQISAFGPDVLLVLSADHVYRYDYRELLDVHLRRDAECTLLSSTVPLAEAGDHAVLGCDDEGRLTDFAYKPDQPPGETVATEVTAYDWGVLREVLEELHRELSADSGLGDFGDHLVPRLVERGRAWCHPLDGYWRDLGQPHLYLRAHLDVLTHDVGVLACPGWPILTRQPQRAPARVLDGGWVQDSMLGPGCVVGGTVRRSVLGPGVVVEDGAVVSDSVVFAETVVRSGARVAWSVVDARCELRAGAAVSGPDTGGIEDPESVTLIGSDCVVDSALPAGSRLEPGSTC